MPTGPHILFVDDDVAFTEAVSPCLRRAGFRVTTATHFDPALKALEGDDCPDLLLVDVVMPGSVNGFALARMGRMRRQDLRVVYLTGYDLGDVEHEAQGPLLRKPVTEEKLLRVIEEALAVSPPRPTPT